MRGLELIMLSEGQGEALQNLHGEGTYKQTDKYINRHCDRMGLGADSSKLQTKFTNRPYSLELNVYLETVKSSQNVFKKWYGKSGISNSV